MDWSQTEWLENAKNLFRLKNLAGNRLSQALFWSFYTIGKRKDATLHSPPEMCHTCTGKPKSHSIPLQRAVQILRLFRAQLHQHTTGAHWLSSHSPLMPNGKRTLVGFSLTSRAERQVHIGWVLTHLSCRMEAHIG
ncbi:unnamed protein product [Prunus armeniaca]